MTTSGDFLLADGDDQGPIHLQGLKRRAAGCGAPEQARALPAEVVVPQVAPRMQEGDVLSTHRVDGGLTCSLAQRARNTSEGEIVAGVLTASYHRHDVVDMKGRFLTQLRKAAVLASVAGTPDDEPAEPGRDVLSQGLSLSGALCPQLQKGQELGQVGETFGFPPLLKGQLLTSVLAIEQTVQAFVDPPRQPEAFQISGEVELDENLLRHADPFEGRSPDLHSTRLDR
jgi:hypothetical protein